jgi:hypothetical protein
LVIEDWVGYYETLYINGVREQEGHTLRRDAVIACVLDKHPCDYRTVGAEDVAEFLKPWADVDESVADNAVYYMLPETLPADVFESVWAKAQKVE